MTSRRLSTLSSILVVALALAAPGGPTTIRFPGQFKEFLFQPIRPCLRGRD